MCVIILPTKHLPLIILVTQMPMLMKLRGFRGDVTKHWLHQHGGVKTQLTALKYVLTLS